MDRSDKSKDKNDDAPAEPDDTDLKKEIDEISGRIDSILKTIDNHFPADRNENPELNQKLNQDENTPDGIQNAGELSEQPR